MPAGDLRATVRVRAQGCAAGLAAVSGGQTAGETFGIELAPGGGVRAWQGETAGGAGVTLAPTAGAGTGAGAIDLAVELRDGGEHVRFAVRAIGARDWRELDATATAPENQRAIRVALTYRGQRGSSASFDDLAIAPLA